MALLLTYGHSGHVVNLSGRRDARGYQQQVNCSITSALHIGEAHRITTVGGTSISMPQQDGAKSHSRASPSCWSSRQSTGRADNIGFLEVSGLRVRYTGPGTEDKDAASVRADCCVPFGCGVYYFEVEVLNKGRNGFVGIGFSAADVSLDRLPGWEPHSFGYHGDDGHAFHHSGKGRPYGPTFGTGDIIGIIFNRAEKTVAYTKNGMYLGVAFQNVCEERLYPTVGMRTPEEEILANFGATPFKGDLDSITAEAAQRVQEEIASCTILSKQQGPRVSERLVFDYLRHQGYWSTAARAGTDLLGRPDSVTASDMQDIRVRSHISEAITAGRIDDAISLLDQAAPDLLQKEQPLNFKLQCQRFMGIIRDRRLEEALAFGHAVLGPLVRSSQDQELLQDALTLLAHSNPLDCPSYQSLLGGDAHAQLAAAANAAVLKSQGRSERSRLESLIRQLEVVRKELLDRGDPATALVDFDTPLRTKTKVT